LPPLTVKKYPNRRLYDTEDSRYITMEELVQRIRTGRDVRVIDAKTDEDLTQPTLVQLLVETKRAYLLPVPLLLQIVRMGDDAVAEFFGRYMTWALEMYFQMKQQASSSWNPFAQLPFNASGAFARMVLGAYDRGTGASGSAPPPPPVSAGAPPPPPSPPPAEPEDAGSVAELRRELEEIKQALKGRVGKTKKR
jgi:polyhydroxyalkanoate synthesis repressor PhaR